VAPSGQGGLSDWDDQDLLFHSDARDRLAVAIEDVRQQLAEGLPADRRDALTHRLQLLESRLEQADQAIEASESA
jgi:hypothetical protein